MNFRRSRQRNLIALFIFLSFPLWGAEITVPKLELTTRGAEVEGSFSLSANAAVDIALNGGYKYGFLLGFSFDSPDLGKALAYRNFAVVPVAAGSLISAEPFNALVDRYNNQATLSFRIAKASARELFGLPLEFSLFTGIGDPFCSGEEFAQRYGLFDVKTDFTGFFYFPEGIGGNPRRRYDGLYAVQGTGFSFAFTKWENFVPMLYAYQDFPVFGETEMVPEKPQFSGDVRFLFNHKKFQAEAYFGISGAKDEENEIRGGLLAFFRSGKRTEFLLQCGIPGWKTNEEFSIDHLFLLFEPRLTFGKTALHATFFYHPLEYLHINEEKERGKADINIKFLAGNLTQSGVQGGFETTIGIKVYEMADYSIWMSPFISFLSSGLQWDLKLRFNPLVLETPGKLFELFAGVKTAF